MKKKFILILMFISSFSYSQELTELNTILTINNEVSLNLTEIVITYQKDSTVYSFKTNYLPGKLKIKKEDLETLKNKKVTLKIIQTQIVKDSVKYKKFVIDNFNFNLLTSDYFILKVYDLSNKNLKKIYYPLGNKDFTFEYDSPLETIRRVKKK